MAKITFKYEGEADTSMALSCEDTRILIGPGITIDLEVKAGQVFKLTQVKERQKPKLTLVKPISPAPQEGS